MSSEIRALKPSEFDEHADLVYQSYFYDRELAPGSMLTRRDWWLRGMEREPYYEPAQTRVMVMDGRLVSSVGCYLRPSYIAGREAKAACIGSVCTHPEYRKRGLVKQVLAEASDWMVAEGFLWSFLFGLEAVYGGSGWRMLASPTVAADVCVRDEFGGDITARPADPATDAPLLTSIYEQFNASLTGPTIRTEEYWRQRTLSTKPGFDSPAIEVLERAGEPIGYWQRGDAAAVELGWIDAPRDVLAYILRQFPGKPVGFGLGTDEVVEHLRAISYVPGYDAWREHRGSITIAETYHGLWRFHQDPDGLFPQVTDTASLLGFLRDKQYVMWPTDRS